MIEQTITWGSLLNILGIIIAALSLSSRVGRTSTELRLTIEKYHAENQKRIAVIEERLDKLDEMWQWISRRRRHDDPWPSD